MGYSKLDYEQYLEKEYIWKERGIAPPKWANEVYNQGGEPTCALDFYEDIFGDDLEEECTPEDYREGEYGAIAVELIPKEDKDSKKQFRAKRYTITRENMELYDLIDSSDNFCMIAPISYAGRARADKNARYMYALALEVDNIRADGGIDEMFYTWQRKNQTRPKPTYVVCSGNGIHLYFIFERPIPMYANIFNQLKEIKKWLVPKYWNANITTMKSSKDIQWEGLCQPFRCVGGRTKQNSYVMAFKVGEKITIEYLNEFLPEELRLDSIYKSKCTKAQAKELYPEWYQKRIVEGKERGHWNRHEGIYHNWIQKIYNGAEDGHRYNCLENLCSLAVQCQIEPEQVEKDCREVAEYLETLTQRENNHFTEYDVMCALKTYHEPKEQAYRRKIEFISKKTGIELTPNKRNGRKQEVHLQRARAVRDIDYPDGSWINKDGRPDKSKIVEEWRQAHPEGRKVDCIRETGLGKTTVNKWWNVGEKENCGNCAYCKKWYCDVMGDYVAREQHCSEWSR